jgi:hypothetical protein
LNKRCSCDFILSAGRGVGLKSFSIYDLNCGIIARGYSNERVRRQGCCLITKRQNAPASDEDAVAVIFVSIQEDEARLPKDLIFDS